MDSKLPLKKVIITAADYFKPGGMGGPARVFGEVTSDVRDRVASELHAVGLHFKQSFRQNPQGAAVGRIVLKDEALAKSHRPLALLEKADCPIIGIGGFGELLVSLRSPTVDQLERLIRNETTKIAVANISTIRTIEPFSLEELELIELASRVGVEGQTALKVRLFRHHNEQIDRSLRLRFEAVLNDLHISKEELSYAPGITIYRLRGVRPEHIKRIGAFVGTQSLGRFPEYHVVRPTAQPVGRLTPALFPPPEQGVDYPVVGVVDTGIDPRNPLLAPWVVGREEFVPERDRDYEHGTFVGGLIVHSRMMNHDAPQFPRSSCQILDVVALPRTGHISEDELLAILQAVVSKHRKVKVWNLSLGGSVPCSDHCFSDFAMALDELQTKYGVTFVLAAGNYSVPPYREWPLVADLGGADRICAPADSVRALTVGSVAHRESTAARAPSSAPSPFSRRGPGPVFLPKPEVSHIGGNCDANGRHAQIGVLSVDAKGNLAEGIGTSFAAPIVASVLAQVQASPAEPLSNLMAKALVVHSAVLGSGTSDAKELNYRGFGIPSDPSAILGCEPWSATLLFEGELQAGTDLERKPFPVPKCLRLDSENFRGEMTVTIAYAPPLDGTFGAEYCRSNVDVSLGIFDPDKSNAVTQHRQIQPFPKRATAHAEERTLVEQGFKWSPVKVYRRIMPRGVNGKTWRLVVAATDRSRAENVLIPIAMVITIADIDRQAPVYNDVVTSMNQMGWSTVDVQIRPRPRQRVG